MIDWAEGDLSARKLSVASAALDLFLFSNEIFRLAYKFLVIHYLREPFSNILECFSLNSSAKKYVLFITNYPRYSEMLMDSCNHKDNF